MTTASADRDTAEGSTTEDQPSSRTYLVLLALFALFGVSLYRTVTSRAGVDAPPEALLGPLVALACLIAVVWTNMLVFRNYAAFKGLAPASYYRTYGGELPPDWVERPARAFNNLMQVPLFFCVTCLLILFTGRLDAAQVALAWVFVATRLAHVFVYIVWNYLPARFGLYVAGVVVLAILFTRFAIQSWDLVM